MTLWPPLPYRPSRRSVVLGDTADIAFSLVEILVVIAIIGLLAALLFPVFNQAREKARQVTCLSNQRQVAMAFLMYTQDYDDSFPWSFHRAEGAGPGWTIWPDLIAPYLRENRDLLRCPNLTAGLGFSANGQVVSLLGKPAEGVNYFQSVVRLSQVGEPSGIVLLGDSIPERGLGLILDDPNDLTTVPMEFAYPHPALSVDHTKDQTWAIPWLVAGPDGKNNKQIAWRHSGGANFAFVDGHAKWYRRGSLRDANFDVRCQPGVGCTGKTAAPNPADYPAPDGTCTDQSPLNCQ